MEEILKTIDILFIFDVILIGFGAYTLYSAIKMKKTKVPDNWLMGEQDMTKCKDVKGFVDYMYLKTILFGIVAAGYGILSIVNRIKILIPRLDTVCIIAFLIACVIYVVSLNRARTKFF